MPFIARCIAFLLVVLSPLACADRWPGPPPADPKHLHSSVERVREFSRLSVIHMNHHTVSMFENGHEYTTDSFRSAIQQISTEAVHILDQAYRWEVAAWTVFVCGLTFHLSTVWSRRPSRSSLIVLVISGAVGLACILWADNLHKQAHRVYFRDLHAHYLGRPPANDGDRAFVATPFLPFSAPTESSP